MDRTHIGKTCPYCQFPLKADSEVVVCAACRIPHHHECWTENGGCTTFGCLETTYRSTAADRLEISFDESSNWKKKLARGGGISKLLISALVMTLVLFAVVLFAYNFYPMTELALNQENLELELGEKGLFLSASIKPIFIKSKPLIWESSNPNVVEIYNDGMIEAIDVGSVIITLKTEDESHQASCIVEVLYPTVVWNDGTYVGRLNDDKPNGFGEWFHPSGESYTGDWLSGIFSGEGTHILPDEQVFIGEFTDGLLQGKGIWSNADGNTYIGEFKDGKKYGKGVYTWADGSEFTGEFIEGLKHGRGVLVSADGKKTEGDWKNDEYIVRQIKSEAPQQNYQPNQPKGYTGTLYNYTNEVLDYYINGNYVARIKGKQQHNTILAAGYYTFTTKRTNGSTFSSGFSMFVEGDGWYYWADY